MKMKEGSFEGGADLTALQRLRRPVVVHHAAWSVSFSGEEEAAELGHLCRADTDRLLEDDPGDTLQQGRRGQRAIIGPVIQRTRKESL